MRTWMVMATAAACHGGDGEGSSATQPSAPPPLSSTAGQFDVDGDVQQNDCNSNEVDDAFRSLELKFDQVSTGLSVLVDPDMGWIPCDGTIRDFTCEWGNAPGSTPGGSWDWTLEGTSDGSTIDATLRLIVTCSGTGDCEECQAVAHITGSID